MIAAALIALGMLLGAHVAGRYLDYRKAVETSADVLEHRIQMRHLDQRHESRVLGLPSEASER